jgi:hypothetical protein
MSIYIWLTFKLLATYTYYMQSFVSWGISSKNTMTRRTRHYACARSKAIGPNRSTLVLSAWFVLSMGGRSLIVVRSHVFKLKTALNISRHCLRVKGIGSKETAPRRTALYACAQSWASGPTLVGNLKPGPASKRVFV